MTQSQHYVRVLRGLGHEVFRFGPPGGTDDPASGHFVEAGFAFETRLESLVRLTGFTPDLLLYIEPGGLIPPGIERAPFPTACVLCDTHCWLEARQRLARFFDHVFLYQRNYLRYFQEHAPGHVHWHPYASDIDLFRPLPVERDFDVAFVAKVKGYPERERIWGTIQQKWRTNPARFYYQREIPEVYSRAKIVLNLPLADDLNFRTFEAMACGAMLLTRRIANGQEVLFQEGKHYAAFSDDRELFEKLDYYLASPCERESIARAGLEEIGKNHRLDQRVNELLDAVKQAPDQGAPVRSLSAAALDREYAWLYEYWRLAAPGLHLAKEARRAGRPWLPLLLPAARSVFRVLFR